MTNKETLTAPLGQFHSSDLPWMGFKSDENKCCFVYGNGGNKGEPWAVPSQCENKPSWIIESKLRNVKICDQHKDEIFDHHKSFENNMVKLFHLENVKDK